MAQDWATILQDEADNVDEMTESMAALLSSPDVTQEQISRAYNAVEGAARRFEHFVTDLEEQDVDDAVLEAAETIQDKWDALSVRVGGHLR